jgi:hypothetical protein
LKEGRRLSFFTARKPHMSLVARFVIFVISLAVSATLALLALATAGLGCLILIAKKPLLLSGSTLPFWPQRLPALEIPAWAGPVYLGLGAFILLVVLPFALALLESLYVACRPESAEKKELRTEC